MSIMEGSDPLDKLRNGYWTVYKANLMLWPWVQAVNFTFVPLRHRVLVVNVVSLGEPKRPDFFNFSLRPKRSSGRDADGGTHAAWNCILSTINSKN